MPRGPLPDFRNRAAAPPAEPPQPIHGARAQPMAHFTADDTLQQERVEQELGDAGGAVRTALSVEPRDGRLCVFMPPVESVEDYLDLIAAAEAAAKAMGLPIHIEGYAPPPDPRLNVIRVAPDPGVIEVNIHPAALLGRLRRDHHRASTRRPRQCRLGADKFMIDGKHTGTGGGNHVVVGGATTLDSPFLRRPDLLRSLILHWQRHPSISYLFSGLFIGPTSQAPRIDEARHDALYELEIALAQMPPPGYGDAPAAVAGRPPAAQPARRRHRQHPPRRDLHRQALLARRPDRPPRPRRVPRLRDAPRPADVARPAADDPRADRPALARPGHRPAHPLGHGAARPLHAAALRLGRLPRRAARPPRPRLRHAPRLVRGAGEFRFPFCGEVETDGVHLELRQALEPWHVLGETGAIGGTVRYTDSSVERLQVKLTTTDPDRYLVACNQRRMPLQKTETGGTSVAAVRFKAWQPAQALHPVIPVHAPLTFDVFDTWSGRAIAGCTYHVAHPGGRSYDTFPVNGNEAEARRLARFEPMGHTAGAYLPPRGAPAPRVPDDPRPAPGARDLR